MRRIKQLAFNFKQKLFKIYWLTSVVIKSILTVLKSIFILSFPGFARQLNPIYTQKSNPEDRNVLVVSYYSPPYRSSYGTQRVTKYCKYLNDFGWKVTFLTTQPSRDYQIDNLGDRLDPAIDVVRLAGLIDQPLTQKGILPPDDFILWVDEAVEGIRRILESKKIAVIVATAPPYSNMLAAAICTVRSGVPLVLDFRDPWSRVDAGWVMKNPVSKRVSSFLEKLVLGVSARIIMTDEKRYIDDYFVESSERISKKVISITNGYDETDFNCLAGSEEVTASNNRFTISYVGRFYSEQNFKTIMKVMDVWAEKYPEDMQKVIFDYAGGDGQFIKAAHASFCFNDHGYVSHQESIRLRHACDVQLFAMPPEYKAHLFSGKIFEMIRGARPILALTRTDGAVARLLASTRTGLTFSQDDIEHAAMVLKDWFDEWQRTGRVAAQGDAVAIASYSRENLARQLSGVLDDVRLGK